MINNPLEELQAKLTNNDKPLVVLSDFDRTLCHDYIVDPLIFDREPLLCEEVILASQGVALFIATARRLNHPKALLPWTSGLVPADRPVILENGGVIARLTDKGIRGEVLGDSGQIDTIHQITEAIPRIINPPSKTQLVVKKGASMVLVVLRDKSGEPIPELHMWLADELENHSDTDGLAIVNSHDSVSIQIPGTTKAKAFRTLLDHQGQARNELHVVGMGDGENDIPIFQEADISIAFSKKVARHADMLVPGNATSAANVLRVVRRF